MRDQYAGDLSDLIKFSLLRALASRDRRLGVAWYYAPGHDGRADGKHVEHRDEKVWHALDADVHAALSQLPERTVEALEGLPFWPARTTFHRKPVATGDRDQWVDGMRTTLHDADLVFLDPDNGLGPDPEKHARVDDLVALRRDGRAFVIIKFPGRSRGATHDVQCAALHGQLRGVGFTKVITVRTSVSVLARAGSTVRVPRPRFFTVVEADDVLAARARSFAVRLSKVASASASIYEDVPQ